MATVPARRRVEVAYESAERVSPPSGVYPERGDSSPQQEPILLLSEFGVVPEEGDNCAILRKPLEAGNHVKLFDGGVVRVTTTVLEGHRIAVKKISKGERLLSWGLPFGVALRQICPGDYVVNERVMETLRLRHVEGLPDDVNFDDFILPHSFDEASFVPAAQVPLKPATDRRTFMGFDRSGAQGGVGTRNYVAVVPTSALGSFFARTLADSFKAETRSLKNCDGVVGLSHTEAAVEAGGERPKNWDLLVRTLAGFVSHPNVAAAYVVGYKDEMLTPELLQSYIEEQGMPLPKWCRFQTLTSNTADDLKQGREVIQAWLPDVDRCERTEQPLSQLRVALQCGGSDAFSGVSGNPAAGTAAKLLIENGGSAVLAETPELIGAESYILSRVKDLATAKKFLSFIDRYAEMFMWHGQSAEANPSGGNKLRGLYNIALKSLGAAKKKHREVSLDGILDYGERLPLGERGYFFLDSPGNDLESIAGQVASGCNAIFFVTGNGSITNFPFVPTIKIITTSGRHRLLERDMDFNAGRFQDGEISMDDLGLNLFNDLVSMSSGARCFGERAGHSQVSIWREWAQQAPGAKLELGDGDCQGAPLELAVKSGASIDGATTDEAAEHSSIVQDVTFTTLNQARAGTQRLGLVLPTSICSGEVARKVADELNASREHGDEASNRDAATDATRLAAAFDRFVALPHTEGCGAGYASDGDRLFSRTMLGHVMHANVNKALLLEHGCEKTHNAWMIEELEKQGIDVERFGFASVQLDGGITNVVEKVKAWFVEQAVSAPLVTAPLSRPIWQLPLAVLGEANGGGVAELTASLVRAFVGAGGTILAPSTSPVLRSAAFLDELSGTRDAVKPSLAFAQAPVKAGAHVMHVPHGVLSRLEILTGLVAAGASLAVVVEDFTSAKALPAVGHPMVPVLHIAVDHLGSEEDARAREEVRVSNSKSYDLLLRCRHGEDEATRLARWLRASAELFAAAVTGQMRPRAADAVGFQVARGPSGFST